MTIKRLQHNEPGPGEWLARPIIERSRKLVEQGVVVEIQWVPGYMGVAGNKEADEAAKEAEERPVTRRCPEQFVPQTCVGQTVTEPMLKKDRHWFKSRHDR